MSEIHTPTGTADMSPRPKLSTGQWVSAALVGVIALGLFGYSAWASYESITALAQKLGIPNPQFVAVGIDGGVFGIALYDLLTTWIRYPIGWLRVTARFFTLGTVLVNGAAGWKPDMTPEVYMSIAMHVFPPVLLLAIVEATRHLLLKMLKAENADAEDPIPFAAWILQPYPIFMTWRRMKLSKIRDRSEADRFEASRRRAIAALKRAHGRRWTKLVAADLVYDLKRGINLNASVARVEAMRLDGGEGAGYGPGTGAAKRVCIIPVEDPFPEELEPMIRK